MNGVERFSIQRPDFGHSQIKLPEEIRIEVPLRLHRIDKGKWMEEKVEVSKILYDNRWAYIRYLERIYPDFYITVPLDLFSIVSSNNGWATDSWLEDPEKI